jgi:hypothetical protein
VVVVVEKLLTVGPSASKVTVKVWVAWLQVLPTPPQFELSIAGRIVMPPLKLHEQFVAEGPIDNSGPPPQLPTLTTVPLMVKVVFVPAKVLK